MTNNSSKGWSISANLSYGGLFYSKLMRYYDGYILGMFKDIIKGSIVFDVGAGNANFGFEAIKAGAKEVFVIENNPKMIQRIQEKKRTSLQFENLHIVEEDMYSRVISYLASKNNQPGIVHFKRCLYKKVELVEKVLTESYNILEEKGRIFIIHPTSDKRLYWDDGFGSIAFDHVAKWYYNKLGNLLKNHERISYTEDELEKICKSACPTGNVEILPNSRPAYNFVSIEKL